MLVAMVNIKNIGARFSTGFLLLKSYQLCRIGRQFRDTTSGVVRPVQVISRLFSHARTYHSPLLPSLHFKSKQLFLSGAINSSMNYKSTQYFSNVLSSKYLCSQAHRHGLVTDIKFMSTNHNHDFINNSVNCKVTACCSNFFSKRVHVQFHRGLMSDTLPANRSDARDTSCEQMRSTPMDIEELVEFLRDENASDICVIRVPPYLDYVDYFVVCNGFGARHLRRMADGLVAEVCQWHVTFMYFI